MPTPIDAMLGLVVAALGILTGVVGLTIGDDKKRILAYVAAAAVVATGLFYFGTSQMRSLSVRRRVADVQRQQQINLQEIQKRLAETQKDK